MNLQGFNKRMNDVHQKMDTFLENIIEEQRETAELSEVGEKNASRNFVDVLLKSKQADSDREEPLSKVTVKALLWDMIMAGTETSATTVEWGLAELIRHPSTMSRVQDELNTVVGTDRLVSEADIPNLNYLQAVVKETFRRHPPAPMGIPHKSMQNCEIAGYFIPAGTQVFVNHWAIQTDPAVWERPLEFDPDRFLSSTVDVKGNDFELIPFGSGRRICPAVNLGLNMVQYTLAQLLHTFDWTLPGADLNPLNFQELDMSEVFGLTTPRADPLTVLAKPRLPARFISVGLVVN